MAKKKNKDSQYEKVQIRASEAPPHSIIFSNKECWRVCQNSSENAQNLIKAWRLAQTGENEFKEFSPDETVSIQRMYLEN